jgi:hypothetical protein
MSIIQLVVGDYSADGHGRTNIFCYESNLSINEIDSAFRSGISELGFDITKFCKGYEDNQIPQEFVDVLLSKGFDEFENCDEEAASLGSESYAAIYLFTAKVGNPAFEYVEFKISKKEIGGYGLFFD